MYHCTQQLTLLSARLEVLTALLIKSLYLPNHNSLQPQQILRVVRGKQVMVVSCSSELVEWQDTPWLLAGLAQPP